MPEITIVETNVTVAINNIFCVGANYADHNKEMGRKSNAQPLIFTKPNSAVVTEAAAICLPSWSQDVHHEVELVLLISKAGKDIEMAEAAEHIGAFGVGIDLTARDVQAKAKEAGKPWAVAKGFDGAAALSRFVAHDGSVDLDRLDLSLAVNGEERQAGNTADMTLGIKELVSYISRYFSLQAGDLIFTGTPSGVAPLAGGDDVLVRLGDLITAEFAIKQAD
jgi:2-keto-4-pentenoate hydratase/2-oxohepta-3-ene-1,7-dioic acid hydratase in catechol pathway